MSTRAINVGVTHPRGPPIYLQQDFLVWGLPDLDICVTKCQPPSKVSRSVNRSFPTYKTGIMGNSDSSGPGMSTGRCILRNVCIGSWTLYDLVSQSEHFLVPNGQGGGRGDVIVIRAIYIPDCTSWVLKGS